MPARSCNVRILNKYVLNHIAGCYYLGMCSHPGHHLPLYPHVCLLHLYLLLLLLPATRGEVKGLQGFLWCSCHPADPAEPVSTCYGWVYGRVRMGYVMRLNSQSYRV